MVSLLTPRQPILLTTLIAIVFSFSVIADGKIREIVQAAQIPAFNTSMGWFTWVGRQLLY